MRMWITAAAQGAAVLGGFASAGATAQTSTAPTTPARAPMNAADGDGDRAVTREQAAADADRRFAAMDANRDGKLTREERRAWREQHRPPPRKRAGQDKRDAEQTQATFRDHALRRFDRIDTNHDGTIDAREREAMKMLMRARRAGHHRPMPSADAAAPTG